jgi:hypothetical protein
VSARLVLPALLALALLAGCGKKPSHLDPPEGAGPDAALFPRAYPNPKYDPQPGKPQAKPAEKPAPEAAQGAKSSDAFPRTIRPEDMIQPSALTFPGSGS